ncbi:FYN-binding protein isoform X2 [Hippocampus comes]|uniref:FYN-binding protein isoform X2 n=1 Tax=Hippocampus comes TaxID=109280 RepID=UPI00094F1511|nr:PREDICTED: FYN-binding protein-like isoform X2 [Hippocampus comes]
MAQTMDLKALRAKFQEADVLLREAGKKPTVPEKPKTVPPPTSPRHYLPAGARPSLLTSINQTLEGRTIMAPRVVFKDEKKESKKPLIKKTSMDKNDVRLQIGKEKLTKGRKEPLDENSLYHKLKKDGAKDKKPQLVTTGHLVSEQAPSHVLNSNKMQDCLAFKWPPKSNLDEVPSDPILDTPTMDSPVLAALIPTPPEFDDVKPETQLISPNSLSSPNSDVAMSFSPGFTPRPSFIPDIPAPYLPSPDHEMPLEMKTPPLPISILNHQGKISRVQPPQPVYHTISIPPTQASSLMPSSPEPAHGAPGGVGAISIEAMLKSRPPTPLEDPLSSLAGSVSALSVLERAEDMSQVRRSNAGDHRILSALQKASRKLNTDSQTNSSVSSTPPPEDLHLPQSPNFSLTDLPPIDLDSQATQHNSLNRGQASATLDVPELLDVLPPQPRNVPLDQASLEVPPKKPAKPVIKTPNFDPPPPPIKYNTIPVPSKLPEMPSNNEPKFGGGTADAVSQGLVVSQSANGEYSGPDIPDGKNLPPLDNNGIMLTGPKGLPTFNSKLQDQPPSYQADSSFPTSLDGQAMAVNQAHSNNYHNDVYSPNRKAKTDTGRKKKGPPKNPYAEATRESNEGNNKTGWFGKGDKKSTLVAEGPDSKELKKREKQRLEKEKRELKEKQEREKKEQKEREKRENEIKKKFKITGYEEAMYRATVTVTTKGRKDDLPVQSGDNISIIRTTNCPKGKWLARDFANNYGYVAVDHVELDIKEMLELGKKASSIHMSSPVETDIAMPGSRTSNHYPLSAESFSDDSEEWTADDEEALSSPTYPQAPLSTSLSHNHAVSMPDIAHADLNLNHQHRRNDVHAGGTNVQAKNEALQKLATFFQSSNSLQPTASTSNEQETRPVLGSQHVVHQPQAMDFEHPDLLILPPPELYADKSK